MKKAIFATLISVIIIILTLTIMPFALNADMEWKSATVSYLIPDAGITSNWSNPTGDNVNFVVASWYRISNPSINDSYFFSQDGTQGPLGEGTVAGIGTPNISVIWAAGSSNDVQATVVFRWGQSVRTSELVCNRVWINEDNKFQFSFWYTYKDNNWVKIYDMSGKMVYEIDMPYDNPNIIVDLPDGMYTVKTFHVDPTTPIQTFVIGK